MDFLFENPIVIIVIIGMITSFLKKLKESTPNKQEYNQKQAKTINNRQSHNDGHSDLKNNKLEQKPIKNTISQDYHQMQKPAKRTNIKERDTQKKETNIRVSTSSRLMDHIDTETSQTELNLNISKEIVINGLVWAEILGPPRSMKPYGKK